MEKEGVSPDQITYLSVLPCCGKVAGITRGKEIHSQIIRQGIPIGEFLSAALIDMYGKTGELADARAVFDQMKLNSSGHCGVSTWNALIGAYGDHRLTEEALALFEEMVSTGNPPDEVTICAVLSACSHGGRVDTALQLLQSVEAKYGISPNTFHHNCVIDALGRAGRLEEAERYMLANQSAIDHVSWMTLLGASRIHKVRNGYPFWPSFKVILIQIRRMSNGENAQRDSHAVSFHYTNRHPLGCSCRTYMQELDSGRTSAKSGKRWNGKESRRYQE